MSNKDRSGDFVAHAGAEDPGLLLEFCEFLRFNKKWWLTPILVTMLLVGMLIAAGHTAATPFIYFLW